MGRKEFGRAEKGRSLRIMNIMRIMPIQFARAISSLRRIGLKFAWAVRSCGFCTPEGSVLMGLSRSISVAILFKKLTV